MGCWSLLRGLTCVVLGGLLFDFEGELVGEGEREGAAGSGCAVREERSMT